MLNGFKQLQVGSDNYINYIVILFVTLFLLTLQLAKPLAYYQSNSYSNEKEEISRSDVKQNVKESIKMTKELKNMDPYTDNLGKAYQFSSKAIEPTKNIQEYYLSNSNNSHDGIDLITIARFWVQIDRVIGDVDENAEEIYSTYKIVYPNGKYTDEADYWINK